MELLNEPKVLQPSISQACGTSYLFKLSKTGPYHNAIVGSKIVLNINQKNDISWLLMINWCCGNLKAMRQDDGKEYYYRNGRVF